MTSWGMKIMRVRFLTSLCLLLFACAAHAERPAALADFERPARVPVPRGNPMTPQKAALGQMLFFDPRLSGSGAISCASCHNPALAWGDGLPRGIGHMGTTLGRRSPTILDVAFGEPYFWDGRAASLEEQAKGPLGSKSEMNMQADAAIGRIAAMPAYQSAFEQAFPGQAISLDTIAAAIATFERTVVSGEAPFDRWVKGDETAVSQSAKRGFVLFNTKAGCNQCHSGWNFSDSSFHDIGLPSTDIGRGKFLPMIEKMQYAFKTPGLREIALRGPYMHDGSIPTLEAVVEAYDKGGIDRPSRSALIKPLNLTTQEKGDLVAFMRTLTSEAEPTTVPVLPR
jgi:cytochrome c peroxidase